MAKNNDLILSCMPAHIIVNNYDNGFGMSENKPFDNIYIYIYLKFISNLFEHYNY